MADWVYAKIFRYSFSGSIFKMDCKLLNALKYKTASFIKAYKINGAIFGYTYFFVALL